MDACKIIQASIFSLSDNLILNIFKSILNI